MTVHKRAVDIIGNLGGTAEVDFKAFVPVNTGIEAFSLRERPEPCFELASMAKRARSGRLPSFTYTEASIDLTITGGIMYVSRL